MAYKSLNQRFPHFGLILLVAMVLAIPLTVWSLNNVSTNTQQHAMTPISGGSPVSNPTNLSATASKCIKPGQNLPLSAYFNFDWKDAPGATSYQIYWWTIVKSTGKFYGTNGTFSSTDSYYKSIQPFLIDASYPIYWKVRGHNSSGYGYWSTQSNPLTILPC